MLRSDQDFDVACIKSCVKQTDRVASQRKVQDIPCMSNYVSPLEANHLVVAHQRGMAVVSFASFEDTLKLRVVIWVPTPCGPMLLMEVLKGLYFRK